nr:hypothetical protein [Yersinia pekkanenii]
MPGNGKPLELDYDTSVSLDLRIE